MENSDKHSTWDIENYKDPNSISQSGFDPVQTEPDDFSAATIIQGQNNWACADVAQLPHDNQTDDQRGIDFPQHGVLGAQSSYRGNSIPSENYSLMRRSNTFPSLSNLEAMGTQWRADPAPSFDLHRADSFPSFGGFSDSEAVRNDLNPSCLPQHNFAHQPLGSPWRTPARPRAQNTLGIQMTADAIDPSVMPIPDQKYLPAPGHVMHEHSSMPGYADMQPELSNRSQPTMTQSAPYSAKSEASRGKMLPPSLARGQVSRPSSETRSGITKRTSDRHISRKWVDEYLGTLPREHELHGFKVAEAMSLGAADEVTAACSVLTRDARNVLVASRFVAYYLRHVEGGKPFRKHMAIILGKDISDEGARERYRKEDLEAFARDQKAKQKIWHHHGMNPAAARSHLNLTHATLCHECFLKSGWFCAKDNIMHIDVCVLRR